jgi:hypothetical protein
MKRKIEPTLFDLVWRGCRKNTLRTIWKIVEANDQYLVNYILNTTPTKLNGQPVLIRFGRVYKLPKYWEDIKSHEPDKLLTWIQMRNEQVYQHVCRAMFGD